MDAAQVSKDEYVAITSILERLNAHQTDVVEGPGMHRQSSWALFEPALHVKVTQDDYGRVSVLVADVQPMTGKRFLEMALAAIKVNTKAMAVAAG